MNVSAAALRELHRIHRQLTDLRGRLERGPKQARAAEANVKRLETAQQEAKQALTRTRVNADERQLQLKQREMRIVDLRAKLNACANNREYQALLEQIAADDQANSVLQDEILEMLEKLDEHQAGIARIEAELAKSRAESEKVRQRVAEEHDLLERELARVTAELRTAEQVLPADFKQTYDRVSQARGENALAEVVGESCGSCFQMLPPQVISELMLSRPVFCKSCGALLYLSEAADEG
ncbi:MAG: phospholipase [Pirellulaceae bacterium]|nr:phospholipase [Pirellulaceae bacterium]